MRHVHRELHREDELVKRGAPGDGEVTAAVELAVTVVIEEVLNPNPTALMHICINGPGQSIRCVYPWYTWYDGKGA